MKAFFSAAIILFFSIQNVSAQKRESQEYKNSVGVKFYPGAVTAKHFFTPDIAGEAISYFYGNPSVRITALAEFHFDINTVAGLKWYIGPGAHISFTRYHDYANTYVGIDGILGLDYKFAGVPVNLSVDWQPSFEFGDKPSTSDHIVYGPGFTGSWAGVAVRYTF